MYEKTATKMNHRNTTYLNTKLLNKEIKKTETNRKPPRTTSLETIDTTKCIK